MIKDFDLGGAQFIFTEKGLTVYWRGLPWFLPKEDLLEAVKDWDNVPEKIKHISETFKKKDT